ncbi:SRPBCC family protein [Luteipulveratus flavus]|uniref:SRPBCC family protein n=1 Tax=Luteipulveratus flavus TaxID=3031728 RepID=A0ABT6C5W8_9MICO|nr:SRPBCC family protein [Luteipulveratus sp. YIM 133296]MDF8264333.1 SRPBCC family protein [Luteipulveratus sp. YIM 133296]
MITFDDLALKHSVEIDAPPERVWDLVRDVRRIPEWSPQVESTRLRAGWDDIALGTEFTNRNVAGEVAWVTHGEIVRYDPAREVAFRIAENWVIWSFVVEPLGADRTRLVQRRETPDGVSPDAARWVASNLGGLESFGSTIRDGARRTLAGIKAAAEA